MIIKLICGTISVVILSVLPTTILHAQEKIVIKYDPLKKQFIKDGVKGIKVNKAYAIQIVDTQNGLFNTNVKVSNFIQSSSAPEVLKFLSIGYTDELRITSSTSTSTPATKLTTGAVTKLLNAELTTLANLEKFLKGAAALNDSLFEGWSKNAKTYDIKTFITEAEKLKTNYCGSLADKDEALKEIRAELQHAMLLRAVVDYFLKDPGINDDDATDFIDKYSEFLSVLELAKNNSDKYGMAMNFVFDVIENTVKYETKADPKIKYYNLVTKETITSEGDLIKLNITLINKIDKDTTLTQTIPFFTYGQFKFDFSTGFYYTPFMNDSYSFVSFNADSSQATLKKDYNSKGDVAIGAELHLTYKVSRQVGLGLNLGSAISPFDAGLRYLLGFHIMIGQSKQIILSGGWALAQVKRISDAIAVTAGSNANEVIVPSMNKEPKLVDKYDNGYFIGISYNLSSVFKPMKK